MKKKIKCKWCGKVFEYYKSTYPNRKFCLIVCRNEYFKKYRIGYCYNKKLQVKGGKAVHIKHPNLARENVKKSHIINKKNKTGFWDLKIQSMGGKAAKLVNAQSKAGKIGGKITAMINKKNKIGMCYDKKIQSRAGKIGGPIGGQKAMESNRKNKPYIWKGVHFMSKMEMEFAKTILKKPIDGVNCNIKVGTKTVDFFPQKYDKEYQNSFVEFHPWDRNGLSTKQYHNQRRKVLNENGYKDYPLIVIKK